MEFLTILVSGILGIISPVGLVIDRTALNAIRSRLQRVEQLQVRVDNAPSYHLLQGKVDRVLIAARGLQLKRQDIRIAALELETEPIDLDPRSLRHKQPKLKRPFQAGVRLVLTQEDINQALKSQQLTARLRNLRISIRYPAAEPAQRYDFVNPKVEFLENNRLRFQVELQQQGEANQLKITVESGLGVVAGHQLQLISPAVSVNGEAAPEQLVSAIAASLAKQLDLRNLECTGITSRILQLKVTPQKLEIAAFLRLEPSSRFLENRRSS